VAAGMRRHFSFATPKLYSQLKVSDLGFGELDLSPRRVGSDGDKWTICRATYGKSKFECEDG
jgi:hypothetical protein